MANNFRERPKEHDWKSCVCPQRCTAGSIPALSARKIRKFLFLSNNIL